MIEHHSGTLTFRCDSCDSIATDLRYFAEAWSAAKADGWTARKVAGEWLHSCPNCEPPT